LKDNCTLSEGSGKGREEAEEQLDCNLLLVVWRKVKLCR